MKSFDEVSALIKENRLLHIAGNTDLLKKLPQGNWVGGSTEYFMTEDGGLVSDTLLFVNEFTNGKFSIRDYGADNISQVTKDAYDSGYSIVIMPFDSDVCMEYARNASKFEGMFFKNIVGWVSGVNVKVLGNPEYPSIVVNGATGEVHTNKAVTMHLEVPESQTVSVNIINIFSPDENSPTIEFIQEGVVINTCLVDGKEMSFADFIRQQNIDTRLPLIGRCFGYGINVDIHSVEDNEVRLGAPVFTGIKYQRAKAIPNYEAALNAPLTKLKNAKTVFSCNCLSNFMHGGLEGKKLEALFGPVVFGEIAYQMLSQTLVYVTLE